MPSSFVEFTGGEGDGDGKDTSDEIGRANEDESDELVEAEGLDDRWEEVLETIGGTVISQVKPLLTDASSA